MIIIIIILLLLIIIIIVIRGTLLTNWLRNVIDQ